MTAPKKPTPEQLKQMRANYIEMRRAVKQAGRLMLDILSHPKATPKQIMEAGQSYSRSCAGFESVAKSMREVSPNGGLWSPVSRDWHNHIRSEMLP